MHVGGLRDSKPEPRCGGLGSFPGGEVMNLPFNFLRVLTKK